MDASTFPPTVTVGNPQLVPEHANDVDVLYERFLQPIGMIRAGSFYKKLADPIVQQQTGPGPDPICTVANFQNCYVVTSRNAGSAYISGLEFSFDQHFTYLPGLLSGTGLIANYSWATSQATDVNPGQRTDKPALLRQAPNTWNIMPSYDRGRLSLAGGFEYNGANIYQYNYADGTPGGIKGPGGDIYLFPDLEIAAQASYRVGSQWTLLFDGSKLNNEVFGFYEGSPQYFIQREYYQPTYEFGFRWDMSRERYFRAGIAERRRWASRRPAAILVHRKRERIQVLDQVSLAAMASPAFAAFSSTLRYQRKFHGRETSPSRFDSSAAFEPEHVRARGIAVLSCLGKVELP